MCAQVKPVCSQCWPPCVLQSRICTIEHIILDYVPTLKGNVTQQMSIDVENALMNCCLLWPALLQSTVHAAQRTQRKLFFFLKWARESGVVIELWNIWKRIIYIEHDTWPHTTAVQGSTDQCIARQDNLRIVLWALNITQWAAVLWVQGSTDQCITRLCSEHWTALSSAALLRRRSCWHWDPRGELPVNYLSQVNATLQHE